MAEKKFNKVQYDMEYSAKNYKHYHLKIRLDNKDVIDKLESVTSKNGYITELIEKDIKASKR